MPVATLAEAVASAALLPGARAAWMVQVDHDGAGQMQVLADDGAARTLDIVPTGFLSTLLGAARPVLLADVGSDPDIIAVAGYPCPCPLLGVPVVEHGRVVGALIVIGDTGGHPYRLADLGALSALADQAAVALAQARLIGGSDLDGSAVEGLWAVSGAALAGGGVDEAVGVAIREAIALAGADHGLIASKGGPGRMTVRAADGHDGPPVAGASFPAAGSWVGEVIRTGAPLFAAIAGADPALAAVDAGPAMAVPFGSAESGPGVLVVGRTRGRPEFESGDADVVQTFAAEVGDLLDHAVRTADVPVAASTPDNERIAMDMHDGVVQRLFAVSLSLEALADSCDRGETAEAMRYRLQEAVLSIRRSVADLRVHIAGLHPPSAPKPSTLGRQLVELCESFEGSGRASIRAEVDPRAAALLLDGAADVIYAAQEALSNAVHHSGAQAIVLSLRLGEDDVVLEVADDGAGFDPDLVRRGRGLSNLRARARSLGGVFHLDSTPGLGTTVRLVIPA